MHASPSGSRNQVVRDGVDLLAAMTSEGPMLTWSLPLNPSPPKTRASAIRFAEEAADFLLAVSVVKRGAPRADQIAWGARLQGREQRHCREPGRLGQRALAREHRGPGWRDAFRLVLRVHLRRRVGQRGDDVERTHFRCGARKSGDGRG